MQEAWDVCPSSLHIYYMWYISQAQQQLFRTTTFWCQQLVTYPVIAKKALEIFVLFVTTYNM